MMHLFSFFALLIFVTTEALRICHHNDFHARYAEVTRYNSPCSESDSNEDKCFSSIARLQSAFRMFQCDTRIHAGDFVQGTIYDSLLGVEIAIAAYEQLRYDILTFGNHEWNRGPSPVYETLESLPNGTTWLASNVMMTDAPPNVSVKRHLDQHGICWVSVLTLETLSISKPGPSVLIVDSAVALNQVIPNCAQQDNVIAVTHLGYNADKALCNDVSALDLVIGGHSHTDLAQGLYPTKVTRADGTVCWVVQASAYGRYMGVLDVHFKDGGVRFSGSQYVPMDFRIPKDPDTEKMMADFTKAVSEKARQVVGRVTKAVDGARPSCRAKECEAGNMLCDAMLAYAGPAEGAELCLSNGGGIRASFDAGDVTYEEVLSMFPFGNVHAVLTIPGSTLKAAIENGLIASGNDKINGRFPQVAGMSIVASFSAPPGSRLRSVAVNGTLVDDDRMYRVVTNAFLVSGGDGYKWPGATDINVSGRALNVLLFEYLKVNNPYTPFVEGRITDGPGISCEPVSDDAEVDLAMACASYSLYST